MAETSAAEKQAFMEEIARSAGTERFPEEIKQTQERARGKAREARESMRRETRGMVPELTKPTAYKKGGYSIDGIAQRGKTRAKCK